MPRRSRGDYIYIQKEVGREKGWGVEDPPETNKFKINLVRVGTLPFPSSKAWLSSFLQSGEDFSCSHL